MKKFILLITLLGIILAPISIHAQTINKAFEKSLLSNDTIVHLTRHLLTLSPSFSTGKSVINSDIRHNDTYISPNINYNFIYNSTLVQGELYTSNNFRHSRYKEDDYTGKANSFYSANIIKMRAYISELFFVSANLGLSLRNFTSESTFNPQKTYRVTNNSLHQLGGGVGLGRIHYIQDQDQLLWMLKELEKDDLLNSELTKTQFHSMLNALIDLKNQRVVRTRKVTKKEINQLVKAMEEAGLAHELSPSFYFSVHDNLLMYNQHTRRTGSRFGINIEQEKMKSKVIRQDGFIDFSSEDVAKSNLVSLYNENEKALRLNLQYSGYNEFSIILNEDPVLFYTSHQLKYWFNYYSSITAALNALIIKNNDVLDDYVSLKVNFNYDFSYQIRAYAGVQFNIPGDQHQTIPPFNQELQFLSVPSQTVYWFNVGLSFRPLL